MGLSAKVIVIRPVGGYVADPSRGAAVLECGEMQRCAEEGN
jgi:hypothetical protein